MGIEVKKEQSIAFVGIRRISVKKSEPPIPTYPQKKGQHRAAKQRAYQSASSSTSLLSGIFRGECAGETVYSDLRGECAGDAVCSDFRGEAVIGPG